MYPCDYVRVCSGLHGGDGGAAQRASQRRVPAAVGLTDAQEEHAGGEAGRQRQGAVDTQVCTADGEKVTCHISWRRVHSVSRAFRNACRHDDVASINTRVSMFGVSNEDVPVTAAGFGQEDASGLKTDESVDTKQLHAETLLSAEGDVTLTLRASSSG
ncbi:hypothetical protein EYF80_014758 [Liparis tanakae]|uniref:Uncharacterized protein n=1 Tax=Liparis tanakae TaxID=230148 RepID=A0A4Z2IC71_9TELE|nr:hypothetical protein EYF80_014758 [Liparis tanakae]